MGSVSRQLDYFNISCDFELDSAVLSTSCVVTY